MDVNERVSQAVGLIRAGQAAEARQILLQVLKESPDNENGWLWLTQTLPDDKQRIAALEQCLRYNPGSEKARLGLERLRAKRPPAQPVQPAGMPPASPAPQPGPPPVLPPVPRFSLEEKPQHAPGATRPADQLPLPAVKKVGSFKPFQPFQEKACPSAGEEEADLGLHISEKQPDPKKPAAMASPAAPTVAAAEPGPFLEGEAADTPEGLKQEHMEELRKTTRNNGLAWRILKRFARILLIVVISAAVYVAGWYAWQVYGGGVTEYVFLQVGLLPSLTPTPGEPTLTPIPSRTPVPTLTPSITPTPVPPTLTPSLTPMPRPAGELGKILFASNLTGGSGAPLAPMALYSVLPDGRGLFQVIGTTVNILQDPAWSRDGSRIAYAAGPADGSKSDLYSARADGSGLTRLTTDGLGNRHPSYSPDGKWIVFSSKRDGNPEIYVMPAGGGKPVRLTMSPAEDLSPAWSPDGTQIAFVSSRSNAFELYTIKISLPVPTPTPTKLPSKTTPQPALPAEAVTRLTYDNKNAANPAWSPDGKLIAFSTDRDGNREIYTVNTVDQRQQRLTSNPAVDDFPAWSPDGAWIVFTSTRDAKNVASVYIMKADGSALYRFYKSDGSQYAPAWVADPPK